MQSAKNEFTWVEGLALFLGCIAIQLSSEWFTQWGTFFYSPPEGGNRLLYVSITLGATIFIVAYVLSALCDPLIGLISDKTRTQPGRFRLLPITGRRRPFIFWGSIGMTFTGILFWHPPVQGESFINFIFATVVLCIHWCVFFAMCAVPFTAIGPEIARSQEARAKIGTWIAAGMILGLAIAEILPGVLVSVLDPARSTDAAGGELFSPIGYQRTGIIFSVVSLIFLQFAVWVVRERYRSKDGETATPPLRVVGQALQNGVFLRYIAIFFLFNIGYLAVQRVLPYWVQVGLGGSEEIVSILMAPFIFCALGALAITMPLAARIPIKWLIMASLAIITTGLPMMYVIAVLPVGHTAKMVLGAVLFAYCGIGQGMQYMLLTPMIGEIIDLDELRSGERREAVYQSISGLVWKGAQALSVYVMALSLHFFGGSVEHPAGIYLVGPIAGLFGLLGIAVCASYPVLHVTRGADKEADKEAV